jgi:hypothetical protein
MYRVINSMIIVITVICVLAAVVACTGLRKVVIKLEGYEHAVYVCGSALMVNVGHEDDLEVKELVALAKEECSKF